MLCDVIVMLVVVCVCDGEYIEWFVVDCFVVVDWCE